jgi:hypothetical protein
MHRFTKFAMVLAVSVSTLAAADVSGIWLGNLATGRRNLVQDFAFQFVQHGNVLTGKVYLDYGSTPILKGTVDGDQVSFDVVAREQDGNQINEAVLHFTGTLKNGEIEITRERLELHNAGDAGASVIRPGKQTFQIKRLP